MSVDIRADPIASASQARSRTRRIEPTDLLVVANALTLSRLVVNSLLVATYAVFGVAAAQALLVLVIVGWLTDVLDGQVARIGHRDIDPRPDGQALDPLVDDFAYTVGFLVLMNIGVLPLWFVMLALGSRTLMAGIRIVGLAQGRPFAPRNELTRAMGVAFAGGQIVLFAVVAYGDSAASAGNVPAAAVVVMTAMCIVAVARFVYCNRRIPLDLLRTR